MEKTLTKKQLARQLADEQGISHNRAKVLVARVFAGVTEALIDGYRVEFRGFGVLEPVERKPKKGRNPLTGQAAPVPARRSVKFKPSALLLEKLNRETTDEQLA